MASLQERREDAANIRLLRSPLSVRRQITPLIADFQPIEVGGFADFMANLRTESTPVSVLYNMYNMANELEEPVEEGYSALEVEDFRGVEKFTAELAQAHNPNHFRVMKRDFMKLEQDLFESRNTWAGLSGNLIGSILNPSTLVPIYGAANIGKVGMGLVKSAIKTSIYTGIAAAPEQALLEFLDPERPDEYAREAILMSSMLSAGLSGLITGGKSVIRMGKYVQEVATLENLLSKVPLSPRSETIVGAVNVTGNPEYPRGAGAGSPLPPKEGAPAGPTAAEQQAAQARWVHEGLKPAPTGLGLEKIPDNPIKRLLNSSSLTAQHMIARMADIGIYLNRNLAAAGFLATPRSAWTNHKIRWISARTRAMRKTEKIWLRMRQAEDARVSKSPTWQRVRDMASRSSAVTFEQFREMVGRAKSGSGDLSALPPEAFQAAKVWDDLIYKPLAMLGTETGLFRGEVYDPLFLNRIYLGGKIAAEKKQFMNVLMQYGRTPEQADAIAESIIHGRVLDHEPGQGIAQTTIDRKLGDIPDAALEPWLARDIFDVGDKYIRSLGVDVELHRALGGKFDEQLSQVGKEYDDAIKQANIDGKAEDVVRLTNEKAQTMKDLTDVYDQTRGTFGNAKDPTSWLSRSLKHTKNFNAMTQLTGGLITLTDIGTLAIAEGVTNVMGRGFLQMAKNMRAYKLAAKEARLAGEAAELHISTRGNMMADLNDQFNELTWIERKIQKATNVSFVLNGVNLATDIVKSIASMVIATRMSESIMKIAPILATGGGAKAIAAAGLSKDMAKLARGNLTYVQIVRIDKFLRQHHIQFEHVIAPQTSLWKGDDAQMAIDAFRGALNKDINTAVITPSPGEKPTWTSTEFGSVLAQYKGYAVSAMQRVVVANLQVPQKQLMASVLFAVGTGGLVTYIRDQQNGIESDGGEFLQKSIERSGILGYITDINKILETMSDNRFGIGALLGADDREYDFPKKLGAILGPSFDTYDKIYQVMNDTAGGTWDQSSARAMRKLLYMNNVAHMNWLFKPIQEGMTP
jgi:hypothetical protein